MTNQYIRHFARLTHADDDRIASKAKSILKWFAVKERRKVTDYAETLPREISGEWPKKLLPPHPDPWKWTDLLLCWIP